MDVRRELYGGVVLTGGTALFGTMRDRLEKELAEVAPAMAKVTVRGTGTGFHWDSTRIPLDLTWNLPLRSGATPMQVLLGMTGSAAGRQYGTGRAGDGSVRA